MSGFSNVTAGTVLRERNTLNAVMNQAIKWNFIKKNPLKEVDAPKEPPPRTRRYTENEIESSYMYLVIMTILNQQQKLAELVQQFYLQLKQQCGQVKFVI